MDKIYHLMSKYTWDAISKEGRFLEGRTNPFLDAAITGEGGFMLKIAKQRLHLVAFIDLLKDRISWVNEGLWDYRLEHITSSDDISILELPVLEDGKNGFVRDHSHYSPRRFMELYGRNLFQRGSIFGNDYEGNDWQKVRGAMADYVKSSVPISSYTGDYKAPEIWLPQDTPTELVREVDVIRRPISRKTC